MLVAVKALHSAIFIVMVAAIAYVLYAGIADRDGWLAIIAISLPAAEGVVYFDNRMRCPLTDLAEQLGADRGAVTDMFMPRVLADRTFEIFTPLYLAGCALMVYRWLM